MTLLGNLFRWSINITESAWLLLAISYLLYVCVPAPAQRAPGGALPETEHSPQS